MAHLSADRASAFADLPFALLPRHENEPPPVWNGECFLIGSVPHRVLAYDVGASGWHEDLTRLHEDETGGGMHFIDVASRRRALRGLRRHLRSRGQPTVLEVGVSGGHFLRELQKHLPAAHIVGADYTRGTLEEIASRFGGVPLVQMDLVRSPLPSAVFDAIVLLNVLEHIERDDLAIAQCFRMLRPGGILVAEVPAGPALYDEYDRELMHFRRYTTRQLTGRLRQAGFRIEESSHIGFLLYPPFWLTKRVRRGRTGQPSGERVRADIRRTTRVAAVGHAVMTMEGWLAERVPLPLGIRCTAVARRE